MFYLHKYIYIYIHNDIAGGEQLHCNQPINPVTVTRASNHELWHA